MTVTHVLDTSAVLAHYSGEPGADQVSQLWAERGNRIAVCVLTLPELRTRLEAAVPDADEAQRAFAVYVDELTVSLPVTRQVAETAMELRQASTSRLPLVGAVIAACAKLESAVLVHRDPHIGAISGDAMKQLVLPDKR